MVQDIAEALGQSLLAGAPPAGYYCHPLKIVVMLLFLVPWLLAAPWVQKDARRVRAPEVAWSVSMLAVGGVSLLIWLLTPMYVLGLLIYFVLTTAVLMAYVVYRNGRVEQEQKILTRQHLANVFQRKKDLVQPITRLKLYSADGKIHLAPDVETTPQGEIKTYNRVQELLYDLIWRRASRVDLIPAGQQTRVRYVIDGVPSDRQPLSLAESEAVIQYLKPVADIDPEERRRPQEGNISVDVAGQPVEITVATAGTTGGQRMLFRILQEAIRTRLNELGLSQEALERIQALNRKGSGLILVSGRPGMGVTSTLYSLLRDHDAFIKHLMTLESAVEVELENVTQNEYKDAPDLPSALSSALRRDPNVVMVDACPDTKTAEIILSAAADKSILLGMPAGDSFVALAKWLKLVGDYDTGMKPLRAVLCQLVLRKLCPTCREAYRPDPQLLAKANLPAKKIDKFYRPPTRPVLDDKGQPIICATCQGSGYLGRTAAFELLEVTEAVRQAVVGGGSLADVKKACRKNKMLYLQEQALRKVIAGETSIQEVLRVSQQPKKQ